MRSFLLKDYKKVIVDGSIFINRFPEALAQELSGTKYYIASSFGAECACYQMHMTKEQRQVFDDNAAVLKKENANFLEHSENLWSGLVHASTRGERVLLITSNLLLIEKIVLRELELDICNLYEKIFMPYSEFGIYQKRYRCSQDQEVDSPVELFKAHEGSLDVHDENRLLLTLRRIAGGGKAKDRNDNEGIEEGAEAYLYENPADPDHMAKLFKHKRRSQAKLDHVKELLELNQTCLHCDWAAMPEHMLFLDRSCSDPLGFLMRRFRNRRTLDVAMSKYEFTLEKKMATALDWCIMLTTELAYLAVFGLYVTDFSGCNFLIPDDDEEDRRINLLDVDSYCRGTYFGGKVDGEVEHWKILDARRNGNKADLIDMSIRLLFAEIFRIIIGGRRPYEGSAGYCHDPEVGLMPEDGKMRYAFPGKLLKLMDQVLSKKSLTDPGRALRLPSLDGLVAVLLQTRDELKECSPDVTYGTLARWHDEGVSWPVNGLGAPGEPPAPDFLDEPARPEKPRTGERNRGRTRAQKQTAAPGPKLHAVRRPNKNDPFTSARLMGAVLEPETMPLPSKPPRERISREKVKNWQNEARQDREKALTLKNWFYKGLFLALMLLLVWLCLFAESSLLYQIRHSILDWMERTAEWWTDEVIPLMAGSGKIVDLKGECIYGNRVW